ncbi:MAG: peptidoglycan editing factor PgeF [Erysipelotrichaceae bacterium]|nr:peptidoglycan editing factor PgeF [Erysipelotrichaceae bacterium]
MIYWKRNHEYLAGTTLRNPQKAECNNTALHCAKDIHAVITNREHLAQKTGIPMKQFVFANQTHSDHIVKVTKEDCGKGAYEAATAVADCDALYTREANLLIGVFTADCVPILLYDPLEKLICAIHSGWMGTTKQISKKALDILINQEGCKPQNIHAFIGASIAYHSFEVGMEVVEKIKALPFNTSPYITYKDSNKAYVDNKGLNYQMLINAGIQKAHITIDKNDTFAENESFFSYRRDKACGRHLSFIVRKE